MTTTMDNFLPTLYQITHRNIVYQWSIGVDIKLDKTVWIVTKYGAKDGKIRHIEKEVKSGKRKGTIAETTKYEQALLQIKSKWKSKKDKEGYVPNLKDLNKKPIIRPMLASKFTFESLDKKGRSVHIVLPAYSQPKLDGLRCLSNIDKSSGKVYMQTRQGNEFILYDNIKNDLKDIFKHVDKKRCLYIDGELYTKNLPFEDIAGLGHVKKIPTKADKLVEFRRKINLMEYHIYDCFDLNDMSLPFNKRFEIITKLLQKTKHKYLKLVKTEIVKTKQDIKDNMEKYLNDGYEGLMLRNIKSVYELKKRSKHLQKYKKFIEDEFKIIGYKEADGEDIGTIVWKCETKDGKPFDARPVGTRAHRKYLYDNGDEYIGKRLTVKFFEYTKDGIPRFPVGKAVREDGI